MTADIAEPFGQLMALCLSYAERGSTVEHMITQGIIALAL